MPAQKSNKNEIVVHTSNKHHVNVKKLEDFRVTENKGESVVERLDEFLFREKVSQYRSNNKLRDLQFEDYEWKVKKRGRYATILLILLFIQNALTFGLVFYALYLGKLAELEIILGVLTTATLLETTAVVKIIYTYLFNEVPYQFNQIGE